MTPQQRIERLSIPEPNTGCWLWLGSVGSELRVRQYGRLTVGTRRDGSHRSTAAHRYSYEVFKGPIPKGLEVCHSCDTPPCVNPSHLFAGTRMDNVRDRESKRRNKPLFPKYGEEHPRSRLTEAAVRAIRSASPHITNEELSKRFGVARRTVSDARRGRTWLIPDPPEVSK